MIPEALASKIRQIATDHNLRIPCGEGCRHSSQSGFRPPLLFEHILWRHNQMPFNWKCTKPGCPAEFFGTIDAVCHAKDAKDGHTIASTDLQPVIDNFFKSDNKEASKWQWEHGYYMLGEMMTKYVIEQLIQEGYLQIGPLCQPNKSSPQMVPFPSISQNSVFGGLSGMARMEAFEMESHQHIGSDTQASLRSAIMMNSGIGKGLDNRQFNRDEGMSNSWNYDSPRTGGYSPRTGGYSPRTPVFDRAGSSPRFRPSGNYAQKNGNEDGFEKEGSFRNLRNIDGVRRTNERRDRDNRFDDSSRFENTPNRHHNAVSCERERGGRGRGRGGFDQGRGTPTPRGCDNYRSSYSSRYGSFSTNQPVRGDLSTKRPYNDAMSKSTPTRDKRTRSWSGSDSGREDGELKSPDNARKKSMPKRQRSWSRSDEDSPIKSTSDMQKMASSLEEVKKEGIGEKRIRRERSYSRSDSD